VMRSTSLPLFCSRKSSESLKSIRHFGSSRMALAENKPSVFITCHIPKPALDKINSQLDSKFIVKHRDIQSVIPRAEFLKSVEDIEGLFCILEDKIDAELLIKAKNLKIVSTMSVGYDHINVEECKKRNIKIGNTPGCLTETTADLTLALLLATSRRIPEAVNAVKDGSWGSWQPEWMCGRDLYGSTVGIVGLGRIGIAVAKRLQGFGCNILYTGSKERPEAKEVNAKFVDLDTLLKESDFVSPHCPLNQHTKNLFNSTLFNKMKKTAIFVNTTRGGVVDQDALYDALTNGKIQAAGLDVTTPEPLPTDHRLFKLDNCLILPHVGSADVAARHQMAQICVDNLLNFFDGKPMVHQLKI